MTRRGATLIEVLVAALVLVAAAIPLIAMLATGSRETSESENALFAETVAGAAIERLLARGYESLAKQAPFTDTTKGLPADETDAAGREPYAARFAGPLGFQTDVRVTPVRTGLLALEATVRWGKVRGPGEHRFGLARLLAQPDLSLQARAPLEVPR